MIFIFKYILLILFSSTSVSSQYSRIKHSKGASSVECRLYSDFFKQYAYASYRFLFSRNRWIFLRKESGLDKTHFSEDDPSGVWYLEPVASSNIDRKNTFYIRNKKYLLEYLRGSEAYQEIFGHENHDVFTSQKQSTTDDQNNAETTNVDQDEFFMWRLEKVPDTHLYHIWNVKLNKPLYSRKSWFSYRSIVNRMMVGIWNDEQPVSEKFEWLLRCRDQRLPDIRDLSYVVRDI